MKKIPKTMNRSVRYQALETLEKVSKGGVYSNLLLNDVVNHADFNEKDRRLFTEMVYGTISRKRRLEYYLTPFIKQAKKIDPWVKTLLLLSLYQFIYLDKVPDHAVINESVEIAKIKGNIGIGKFVNGVLRSFQRKGAPSLELISDPLKRLSIEISLPEWLTKKFVDQIGFEETKKLGLSLLEKSRVSGRIDIREITREQAIQELIEEGISVSKSFISPYGVVADKGVLSSTQLFQSGKMTIQDESSMLVAPMLRIEPHHKVLDACAAPGGKTTHIATFLSNEHGGRVTALDIHDHKIKLIEENARRLHVLDVVETKKLDARDVQKEYPTEYFDRILVDAPCSGLGLMRRKPDIRYQKTLKDIQQLPKIQLEILESVAHTLKQWGIIVYSTCTIVEEENQQVIESFLAKHQEYQKIDIIGEEYIKKSVSDQMLNLYPQEFLTDGFFICCMQKVR